MHGDSTRVSYARAPRAARFGVQRLLKVGIVATRDRWPMTKRGDDFQLTFGRICRPEIGDFLFDALGQETFFGAFCPGPPQINSDRLGFPARRK